MDDFGDLNNLGPRLDFILAGRKKHPWGKTLGFTSGMVNRVFSEEALSWEALRVIMYAENVRPGWLAEGKNCSPFSTHTISEYEDYPVSLSEYIDDDHNWNVVIATDLTHITLILHQQAEYEHRDKSFPYNSVVILNGPTSSALLPSLTKLNAEKRLNILKLNRDKLRELGTGWVSNLELFGDDKNTGLIQLQSPISQNELESLVRTEKPNNTNLIDISLMRCIVRMLEDIQLEEGLTLSPEEKSKVVTAAYRHAQRLDLTPEKLDPHIVLSLIEVA